MARSKKKSNKTRSVKAGKRVAKLIKANNEVLKKLKYE
jgi:ribosomal protein L39E